jgi:hypothetical protein
MLTEKRWDVHLLTEKYGEWRWHVSVVADGQELVMSEESMFWFNPSAVPGPRPTSGAFPAPGSFPHRHCRG